MALLEGHLNLNPVIKSGGELAVVDDSALMPETLQPAEGGSELSDGNGRISVYVVRPGDTMGTIAKMFGVSINTIAWANDIKGGVITPGQELVILPISGVQHKVVKGDTLASIAKKYGADLDELLSYNGFSATAKLAAGDIVIVPDGEISSSVSSGSSRPSSTPNYSGYYMRPLSGGHKTQGIHGHNGVDIGGPIGMPVLASADGTVIIARNGGWNGGYGSYVVVNHPNGTQTLYAHLSAVNVTVGTRVTQGKVIGALGNTGKSTGPHLHFEVRGAKNPF
jgi:LysM repeat protein